MNLTRQKQTSRGSIMKQELESILIDIIKQYLDENKKNLFEYPNLTLDTIMEVVRVFNLKCSIGKLGAINENN